MRQAGDDLEAIAFRALLMRMRDGKVTEERLEAIVGAFNNKGTNGSIH